MTNGCIVAALVVAMAWVCVGLIGFGIRDLVMGHPLRGVILIILAIILGFALGRIVEADKKDYERRKRERRKRE